MRITSILFFYFIFTNSLFSQVNSLLVCGSTMNNDLEKNIKLEKEYKNNAFTKSQNAIYTLPIVIHVLYNDIGSISNQQIDNAINNLNLAFANHSPYNPMTGTDTELQFCLAKQDPEGNFTTGINRVQTPLATSVNTAEGLSQTIHWNAYNYINIYVVPNLCNAVGEDCNFVLGYASSPSLHGSPKDGIYIQTNYFGTSSENTAVLVHELGHYLGLLHTFQGGCSNNDCLQDGDKVCDTPPDAAINYTPCGEIVNTCTTDVNLNDTNNPFSSDQSDMTWNYMDYGFSCYSAFTQGQKNRMHFFLENVRQSILESNACMTGCTLPIVGNFETIDSLIEVGSNLTFTNNTVNGETFEWFIDDILVSNSIDFNYNFNQAGVFTIRLVAYNNDVNCVQEYTQTIEVFCPIEPSINASALIIEVGESINFLGESNIENFEWYRDGNLVSTNTEFDLQFDEEGTFEVSLLNFQDNPFCQKEVSVIIRVLCPVDLNISIHPNILNVGDSILLVNNSLNASNIEWFIDGMSFGSNDTLVFLPSDAGEYLINLSGTNELCEEELFQNIVVQGNCEGTFDYFQNEYTSIDGFNFEWGRNPILFDSTNNQLILNHKSGRLSISSLNGDITESKFFTSNSLAGLSIGGVEFTDSNNIIIIAKKSDSLQVVSLNTDFTTNWIKTINSAFPFDAGGGLIKLPNNTYSFIYFSGTQAWNGEFHIINFSEYGEINWSHWFPLMGMFVPNKRKIVPLNDNSTIALVTKWDADNRLLKFDSNGNKIWEKAVFNSLGEVQFISNIFTLSDKILVFPQNSFADNQSIICLNENGEKLWEKTFLEPFDVELKSVFPSNENNEILVTGEIQGFPDHTGIIKLSEDGDYLEHFEFAFDEISELQFIENDLFIAATTQFPYDDILVKLDSLNNQQLCSSLPNSTTIIIENSSEFITDTITASFSSPSNQIFEPDTICPIVDNIISNNRICGDFLVDITLKILEVDTCQSQLNINIEICNEGLGSIFDNLPISFYDGNPSNLNTNLVYTDEIGQSVFTDSCIVADFIIPVSPSGQLYLIINDNGIAPVPFNIESVNWGYEQVECKYGNNVDSIFYTPYLPTVIDNNIDTLEFCGIIDTTLNLPFTFQSYHWNNNTQDSILTINTSGHYTVTVIDDCGFEQTKEWEVRQFPTAFTLDLGEDILLCEGSIQILEVSNEYPSIFWQDGSFAKKFTAWYPGIYWVEVTDACGNTKRDSIEIILNEEFNLDLGEDIVLCKGDTFSISATTGFDNYQWSPRENFSCDTCSNVSFIADSTMTIALQASNDDGCYSSDTLHIQVRPHYDILIDTFECDTEFIIFDNIEINSGESYTFELQSSFGCDSIVTVSFSSSSSITTDEFIAICPDESIMIFDNLVSEAGLYSKSFLTHNGCDSTHNVSLSIYENFAIDIITEPTCEEENNGQAIILINEGTPPFSFDWTNFNNQGNTANNLPLGDYQVFISDSVGCNQVANFSIPIYSEDVSTLNCEPLIFAPNVFSPNGDSNNDYFYIQSNERVTNIHSLKIFDRWGELVFKNVDIQPNDESMGWNGVFDGELMNPQVFIWQAEVEFLSGERKVFYGNMVLVR